jgi:predicted  nucleic acid-binding Zn-ribbon protein
MVATIETTIGEQLRALVRLQHVDSKIDQLKKLRGDLPEEIRDLEDEKAGLETRLEKLETESKETEVGKRQSELDIKESEELIKRYEEQQLQVRNNREYDALTKEIEAQRQRITDAQANIELMDSSVPEREESVVAAKARLTDLDLLLDGKRKELEEVLDDTKSEQAQLEEKRAVAAESVDARYLRAYDRLRTRVRDGRAVVPLVRGAAAGYSVPPQRQVEIRQGNRIVACEHTGRIIVESQLYEVTSKEMEAEL